MSAYDGQYNVTESMFCAGRRHERHQDTCKGDSGGGFVVRGSRRGGRWTLQGIVSWGDKSCGRPGKFSVYTRVLNFSHWLRRTVRAHALKERRSLGRSAGRGLGRRGLVWWVFHDVAFSFLFLFLFSKIIDRIDWIRDNIFLKNKSQQSINCKKI